MVALPTISSSARGPLDEFLQENVQSRRVPAMFIGATNAKEEIYFNQAGEKVFGDASKGEVGSETTTEFWSQTKFLTCVCAMQLVDRGVVTLDDPEDVAKYLPELVSLPLLKGYDENDQAILVKPERKVTLRMLMSHTAGTAYPHADPDLAKYLSTHPVPAQFLPTSDISSLLVPFVYEPGTSWRYSNGIDWVGLLVERACGKNQNHEDRHYKLGDYMRDNLFEPVGATSLTFDPTPETYARKMTVCERDIDGKVHPTSTGFGFGRSASQEAPVFHFGGQGLYGAQRDALKVYRGLLQCDPKWRSAANVPESSKPFLSPESWAELFKPSVPAVDVEKGLDGPAKIIEMVSKPKYIDPPASVETVNHSIACLITLGDLTERRKAVSGCWSGVAKTQWWIDPTTGVAGVCATQLMAPAPDYWFQVYVEFERRLYAAIAQSQ